MDGDNLDTLDEALAFIDYCEKGRADEDECSSANALEPLSLEDIEDLLGEYVDAISPARTKHSSKPQTPSLPRKKRSVRSALSSSTDLQRRKKAELEALRKEAAKLAGYLALLRAESHHSAPAVTSIDAQGSSWRREVATQRESRQQAEQMNARLKETLEKQWRVSNKLKGMIFKRNVFTVSTRIKMALSAGNNGSAGPRSCWPWLFGLVVLWLLSRIGK
ncbi:hypothetical protein ON010_g11937 [Phytophthora cinnamomi]|nr:hypothetical protein ON010_g11937 [Phytophthora cinnamomi]